MEVELQRNRNEERTEILEGREDEIDAQNATIESMALGHFEFSDGKLKPTVPYDSTDEDLTIKKALVARMIKSKSASVRVAKLISASFSAIKSRAKAEGQMEVETELKEARSLRERAGAVYQLAKKWIGRLPSGSDRDVALRELEAAGRTTAKAATELSKRNAPPKRDDPR